MFGTAQLGKGGTQEEAEALVEKSVVISVNLCVPAKPIALWGLHSGKAATGSEC